MLPVLAALVFVGLIFVALWLHSRSNVRLAHQHMAGREALPAAQFGRRFFPERQASVAGRLRELLAAETAVQLERLHPDDRPVQDLKIDELDSLAIAEFVIAVEKEYGITLADADMVRVRTFRDVVELVCREIDARTA